MRLRELVLAVEQSIDQREPHDLQSMIVSIRPRIREAVSGRDVHSGPTTFDLVDRQAAELWIDVSF
jgi:hypothetical protein